MDSCAPGWLPFPAHDHPRAFGVTVQVDQMGKVGDLHPVARLATTVDGRYGWW